MVGHPTPAEDDPSGKRYAFEMGAAKTSGRQGGADVAKLEIFKFIAKRKHYPQEAKVTFHFADYRNDFNEPFETFDLLISQYAGFVGQHCKPYLKIGGLLVTNNSHGDAGMAAIDDDYQLKAVFTVRNGKYRISETNLNEYFVPKSQIQITRDYLEKLQKGIGYKKTAGVYLFQKAL